MQVIMKVLAPYEAKILRYISQHKIVAQLNT